MSFIAVIHLHASIHIIYFLVRTWKTYRIVLQKKEMLTEKETVMQYYLKNK